MPESSSQTQTDRQQRDGAAHTSNIVSVVSRLADENLTLVRNISTGLAVAGVIVIARSIRLITKFRAASEIPARFIERNVSLRGKVHSITEKASKWSMSPFICQSSLHYSLSTRMCLRLRCRSVLQEWS
uniref:Uncharacterized protein n=1 Tax=Salarias fasciatus TaxID=181472 RepID=A0A672FVM3_SALFA